MNYGDIVSKFAGAESADQLDMGDGRILYYNGIPTIKMKTALAKAEASGNNDLAIVRRCGRPEVIAWCYS
jgi:hypothetical protein